ncbi:caspase domain-containing protein [Roseivirga sp. BDSF3-8]|uniref:caspase family protein n=1 Tax=Roseivirga sp. BDSF3-8 TaxID=3241598 RepID=UPI0035326914
MNRALLVGIDHYKTSPLNGCINDARSMSEALCRNDDESLNFSCMLMTSDKDKISRHALLSKIDKLFSAEADLALLYFSGHGYDDKLGGLLVTQEAQQHADGVHLDDVLTIANRADRIKQIFIILDCCHSGHMGNPPMSNGYSAYLRKNISILTSSQGDELSMEVNGHGLFTSSILNGLTGGAADVLGRVTAASLYSYVDSMLGPWEQRPVFKSHVNKMISIRKCKPMVSFALMRKITSFFPVKDHYFPLDPSYEPTADPKNPENEGIFAKLQKYVQAGLVRPVGEEHMYFAAMNSKGCELTPQGRMYWEMVKRDRL